jgi:cellulose synthase/poly-beta-1,6-N-acetylglucosamine synthase-like glycosyltransferase
MLWDGLLLWLSSLTIWDLILILWPLILIDLTRSAGKPLIILLNAIYSNNRKRGTSPNFLPKVSIIIPAHNEEKVIVKSIESAINVDYPNKEIIVVDDGSEDGTEMQ